MNIKGSFIYHQRNFISSSFCSFQEIREKGELIDFKVCYGNRSVVGHRLILAASVPYFRTLFSRSEQDVYLEEINPDSLESIINFAYNGKIEITAENVNTLLVTSKFLQITQVYNACWEFLENGLDLSNVWEIRKIAKSLNHTKMEDIADQHIRENFEAFSKSEVFSTLPFSYLKTVVRRDDIKVSNEESVCKAIIRWAKSSPVSRRALMFKLLSDVRFSQLSLGYLTGSLHRDELVQTTTCCKVMIEEAMLNKFPSSAAERPRMYMKDAKPLESEGTPNTSVIFALCLSKSELSVRILDLENGKWKNLSSYGNCCQVRNIIAFEGKIYIFLNKTVITFDVETLEWCQLLVDYNSLPSLKSVLHGSKIYLFGVSESCKGTVQCFDPRTNAFLMKGERKMAISDPGVASLKEYIYVTGGTYKGTVSDIVKRYDPHTEKWTGLSPMLCQRWEHGCASLSGTMYVCGGYHDSLLDTAEIYDPLTDQWKFIFPMNAPKWELTLIPCNGKLYTYPKRPWYLNTQADMEIYDPEHDAWELGPQIPHRENCEIFLAGLETSPVCSVQGQIVNEENDAEVEADVNSDEDFSQLAAECGISTTHRSRSKKKQRRKKKENWLLC